MEFRLWKKVTEFGIFSKRNYYFIPHFNSRMVGSWNWIHGLGLNLGIKPLGFQAHWLP